MALRYITDDTCEEANQQLAVINEDPITKHYGIGSEVSEGWIKKHIEKCEKCKQATLEASMP